MEYRLYPACPSGLQAKAGTPATNDSRGLWNTSATNTSFERTRCLVHYLLLLDRHLVLGLKRIRIPGSMNSPHSRKRPRNNGLKILFALLVPVVFGVGLFVLLNSGGDKRVADAKSVDVEKLLKDEHSRKYQTAVDLNSWSNVFYRYIDQEDYKSAEAIARKAIKDLAPDQEAVLYAKFQLVFALIRLEEFDEAEELGQQLFQTCIVNSDYEGAAIQQSNLSIIYEKIGEVERAEKSILRAVTLVNRHCSSDESLVWEFQYYLHKFQLRQHKRSNDATVNRVRQLVKNYYPYEDMGVTRMATPEHDLKEHLASKTEFLSRLSDDPDEPGDLIDLSKADNFVWWIRKARHQTQEGYQRIVGIAWVGRYPFLCCALLALDDQ